MPSTPNAKRKKVVKRAHRLLVHAASGALAADICAGRMAYPSDLMPLSKCRTLNADPTTNHNYNPIGELGEQRHTPRHNIAEEDRIDGMTPREADEAAGSWPSSCGTVVNAGSVLRDAMRLNRAR